MRTITIYINSHIPGEHIFKLEVSLSAWSRDTGEVKFCCDPLCKLMNEL